MQFDTYNNIQFQQLINNIPDFFYAGNTNNWSIERIERDEMGWDFSTVNEMRVSGISSDKTKRTCIYDVNGVNLSIKFTDLFPNFDTYENASYYMFKKWCLQFREHQGELDVSNLEQYKTDFLKLKDDQPHLFV